LAVILQVWNPFLLPWQLFSLGFRCEQRAFSCIKAFFEGTDSFEVIWLKQVAFDLLEKNLRDLIRFTVAVYALGWLLSKFIAI
jgi:hypothetical protein